MIARFILPLALLTATPLGAAEMARALLIYEDDAESAYLIAASPTAVRYTSRPESLNRTDKLRSEIQAIYFYEPPIFAEAMQLFEGRDYSAAREKFAECKEAYKPVDDLPNNYSTLAAFYELECCRKLMDLEGLKQRLDSFQSASLVRESHKNQEQVYILWDAVRTKSWPRLDTLAREFLEKKDWTGSHLAQIYYCHGLALEALGRPTDALNAFNGTVTADYTASEVITKDATTHALRILKNHDEVKLAMELWKTEDEDPNSTGYFLLQEGVALCDLWKKALGDGDPLPTEFSDFLRYRADGSAPAAKPAKTEDKKEEAKPADDDEKKDDGEKEDA